MKYWGKTVIDIHCNSHNMNYGERLHNHRLVNLASQLKGPTLVRVDINLPFEDGAIAQDAMRMKVYANIAELYSSYVPLVMFAHQGRKGDEDFSSLKPHYKLLLRLTEKADVDFIEYEDIFTEKTRQRILQLKPGNILLLDNVRYFDHETAFDPSSSPYIKWFKGVIQTCVNDAIPVWHRDNSSLMCLPYIAPTFIGVRSSYELNRARGSQIEQEEQGARQRWKQASEDFRPEKDLRFRRGGFHRRTCRPAGCSRERIRSGRGEQQLS